MVQQAKFHFRMAQVTSIEVALEWQSKLMWSFTVNHEYLADTAGAGGLPRFRQFHLACSVEYSRYSPNRTARSHTSNLGALYAES